jgi:hypothetical protein
MAHFGAQWWAKGEQETRGRKDKKMNPLLAQFTHSFPEVAEITPVDVFSLR